MNTVSGEKTKETNTPTLTKSSVHSNNPWAGLGAKINPEETLEVSLERAELDWTAKRVPECWSVDGELVVGDDSILYRSDNKYKLGNVTDKYNIVQPNEVIQSYKDLAALKNWPLEYMGVINDGRRIWALAKTDRVIGNTVVYLLLTTTYDGSSGTIGKFLNLAKDCSSISLAVGENSSYAKFSVNHKSTFDPDKLSQKLNLIDKAEKNYRNYVKTLSGFKMTDVQMLEFLLLKLGKGVALEKMSTRQQNIIKRVVENYMSHTHIELKGTALGLMKSLAWHVDYNVGINVNNRMRAAWFGLGDRLKVQSFNSLLDMAKVVH